MRPFLTGAHLELRIVRANPDRLIPFFIAPLFTIIFLAVVRHAGRHDLQSDALMAPVLMTLWSFALFEGGTLVTSDRLQGMLEWVAATPSSLATLILGRIAAITVVGLGGFLEVWATGKIVFGVSIAFEHPLVLALTLLTTAFAMAGTAVAFAALFVLTRNAYTFVNAASFPFYVLGGVFVPVAALPGWIEPVTKVVFMSWSADLLRASVRPAAVHEPWARLGMVVVLGAASFALGRIVLHYVVRRMRTTGELATA